MALTRSFVETIKERAEKDPKFRIGLLTEAAECFLNGDMETGKTLLRDYVNATIGFPDLAKQLDKQPESLMRMLRREGQSPRRQSLPALEFASSPRGHRIARRRRSLTNDWKLKASSFQGKLIVAKAVAPPDALTLQALSRRPRTPFQGTQRSQVDRRGRREYG